MVDDMAIFMIKSSTHNVLKLMIEQWHGNGFYDLIIESFG